MECNDITNAKRYLARFYQILNQMEEKMLSVRVVDNITIYFIRCMIPHHKAAIYMCENLLKYTNYPPLQEIAHNIIETQTRGIEQMEEIAQTTCGYNNCLEDVFCYQKSFLEITQNMINKMRNSPRCTNINLSFVGEMIPHHEGAIFMCENLLQYCIDPRLIEVAKNIIKEQTEGVKQMEEVRRNLCNASCN